MTRTLALPQQRDILRIYWLEAKYAFLEALRLPIYSVSIIVFPLMFYTLFGLVFGGGAIGNVSGAAYSLATYGAFATIGASLFGFGAGIASERSQGWLRLKRASPMPPLAYFTAKMFVALVFSAIVIIGLFLMGFIVVGLRLEFLTWSSLFLTLLVGALPFCALGLMFGYVLRANAAPAILNLVYLPMAFISGLWMPIELLPKFIQTLAPLLPAYHYGQLALQTIGASASNNPWTHAAVLLGFTIVFLMLAVVFYRRDEGKTYG